MQDSSSSSGREAAMLGRENRRVHVCPLSPLSLSLSPVTKNAWAMPCQMVREVVVWQAKAGKGKGQAWQQSADPVLQAAAAAAAAIRPRPTSNNREYLPVSHCLCIQCKGVW